MNFQEASAAWQAQRDLHAERGAIMLPSVRAYTPESFRLNSNMAEDALALDAQTRMITTPSGGIPALLTTMIDPQVFRTVFAPTRAAIIYSEVKKGTWLDDTAIFPVIENMGEVSSYGDFNNNGHVTVNTGWPQRQAYLFQTHLEYGEREMARAGLAKINWVGELQNSAAMIIQRFLNNTYFFGVRGMQNYGWMNDPSLAPPIQPAPKAWNSGAGITWMLNGAIMATANEIFADIQALYGQLVAQTMGLVDLDTKLVLAVSPGSQMALTATNSFGVSVYTLLKQNFPNIRIETAVQYGVASALNPQGVVAGNFIQLFATEIEGQPTGYCAFSEKYRQHVVVPDTSSWKQKISAGSWGAIIRMPMAVSSMVGI